MFIEHPIDDGIKMQTLKNNAFDFVPTLGYNNDMALKKINIRFAPGKQNQVQLMLHPQLIEHMKMEGNAQGRDFAGQARWILSQILNIPPLEGKKIIDTLRKQTENISGHVRTLLDKYYKEKGLSF